MSYFAGANILMESCTTFGQEDANVWRVQVDGLMKGYNLLDFPVVALIILLTLSLCRRFD